MKLLEVAGFLTAASKLCRHIGNINALVCHQHQQVKEQVADLCNGIFFHAVFGCDNRLARLLRHLF